MLSNGKLSVVNYTSEDSLNFYQNNNNFTIPDHVKVIMASFLTVFMVLSVIGNMCTCVVIIKNKSMKSPTNYYLLNLALSDLVYSIFIPFEIYSVWIPDVVVHETVCIFIHFIMFDLLSNCSVLTILAFTIERYLAISKPFFCRTSVLTSRVFKIISLIWILSRCFTFLNTYFICGKKTRDYLSWFTTTSDEVHMYFIGVSLTVFFVLPMTIIIVLFVLMVFYLKSPTFISRTNQLHNIQNKQRAINMLAAVAASFFICWSPYFAIRLMTLLKDFTYENNKLIWDVCIFMSSINSYMSAALNPILYSLMSTKFRQAFKNLLGIKTTNKHSNKSSERRNIQEFSENIAQSSN